MLNGLRKKRPDAAARIEFYHVESSVIGQALQTKRSVAKEIVRFLVRRPIHGSSEQDIPSRLEHAGEFTPDSPWIGHVFENLRAKNRVERSIGKRDAIRRAGEIDRAARRIEITGALAGHV